MRTIYAVLIGNIVNDYAKKFALRENGIGKSET